MTDIYDFSADFAKSLFDHMVAINREMEAHANLRKPLHNFIPTFQVALKETEESNESENELVDDGGQFGMGA